MQPIGYINHYIRNAVIPQRFHIPEIWWPKPLAGTNHYTNNGKSKKKKNRIDLKEYKLIINRPKPYFYQPRKHPKIIATDMPSRDISLFEASYIHYLENEAGGALLPHLSRGDIKRGLYGDNINFNNGCSIRIIGRDKTCGLSINKHVTDNDIARENSL